MKHTPILLLTLVAASASAAGVGSGLNYNRVEVGYLSNDALKGYSVSATAELAHSGVLVSGVYADVDGKGAIAGYGGYETGFTLAYKFNVGAGDLAVGFGYLQGQFGASNGVAVAEQKSFGLQYRQALGSSAEFSVGYQRVRTNLGALDVDGLGNVYIAAGSVSDNVFNVGLRYNFTQNLDVSLTYAFASKNSTGNTLGVSAGYSF
ncbi:MAG: hypothetical protein ORN22_04915 [Opitutales bacterium]|nr:hypothetical protein [Opitutales bacterium]